ncbi:3-hydroxybutyryl-CoA dehydrogenase [Myxococcota bacterium]|nr:3-hydroxybutyryl-CoA dehydrogenase [Myxococcota bacterium]
MTIQKIGILGAGQMGRGIAQTAAQAGLDVLLADIDQATADKGKAMIEKGLVKLVGKGKIDDARKDEILAKIQTVASLSEFKTVQMAIEAATENEELKKQLFRNLDEVIPADAILATNTSSISITLLASGTGRPEKVIGMHFMNPVPVMKLVEVIRGDATTDETYEATVKMAEALGKTVVTSTDYPGFIVNRILMPMINEAAFALMEGVASAKDIDAAMKLGTNQPMGPLVLADFIGLDTCLAILEVLHEGHGDPKYRPCPLLKRMVNAGRLGKKVGHGFHLWE